MARKPTVKEQRQNMIDAYFSDDFSPENDPLVRDVLARQKREAEQERRPDFSGVEARSSTTANAPAGPVAQERGGLDSFIAGRAERLQPSNLFASIFGEDVRDAVAPSIESGVDSVQAALTTAARDSDNPFLRAALAYPSAQGYLSPERARVGSMTDEGLRLEGEVQSREAQALQQRSRKAIESMPSGIKREVTEAVADFANDPTSALSVIGGPANLLSMGSAYIREYDQARRDGMSEAEATQYASAKSAPEAIGFLPAGKVLDKIPGVNRLIGKATKESVDNVLTTAGKRVAKAVAGESLEEGATSLLQMGVDAAYAQSDNETISQHAQKQLPKTTTEFFNQVWRAMKAGAVGGGALSTPINLIEASSEAGRRAGEITSAVQRGKDRAGKGVRETEIKRPEGMPQVSEAELAFPEEIEAAYRQRDEQAEAELRAQDQRNLELGTRDLRRANVPNTAMGQAFQRAGLDQFADLGPAPEAAPIVDSAVDQVAAEVVPAPVAQAPVSRKRTKRPPEQTQQDFTNLLQDIGPARTDPLASQGTGEGVTLDELGRAFTSDAGSAGSGRVAALAKNRNLEFVQSVDDIGIEGLTQAGKGFYDPKSGKVYVVADNIDRNNIKGEVLGVLAHEIKHGADIGGSDRVRGSFSNLVGDEANRRIVQQIRNLAKTDANARKVVDFVEENYGKEDWDLELPAVYLQQQRDARNPVMRNIVSAVRTRYKKATGRDDLNLNDISYVADQLVRDVAAEAESFTPVDDTAKSTFIGRKARNFQTAEDLGLTYDSKDGGRKYWISDRGSKVRFNDAFVDKVTATKGPVTLSLGSVLEHPGLFSEYPQLKQMPVEFTSDIDTKFRGAFYPTENLIRINKRFLKPGEFNTPTHQVLLHELQHAVQAIEGHEGGSNPSLFLPESYDADVAAVEGMGESLNEFGRDAYRGSFKKYGINTMGDDRAKEIVKRAEEAARKEMDAEQYNEGNVNAGIAAAQAAIFELSKYDGTFTDDIKELRQIDLDAEKLEAKNQLTMKKAIERYMRNLGEQEARFTEKNIDTPVDQVPENPEKKFKDSEVSDKAPTEVVRPKASLSIPRDMDDLAESSSVGLRVIKRLFTPTSGFGHELNEMRLHSRNLVASEAAKAEDLGRDLASAIKQNVKDLGIPEDQLRADIEKQVDEIDEIPDAVRRAARIDALDRKYPGVGRALNALRNYKWALTRELIALRARDPKDLTEQELAIYQKAVQRAETYNTRAYLTTLGGDAGKTYGKVVLKRAKRNPNSPEGKRVQAAVDWLVDNQLVIPRLEGLRQMTTDQLRRLHDQWIGPADGFKGARGKATMIDRLDALERKTRDELEPMALDIVKELMGQTPEMGAVATYYRGGKQNRTILQTRKDIPKPLREVMGEVTDPYLREMLSVARMTSLIGKTKLLTQVFEDGAGRWWSDTKRDGFEQRLTGEAYGPLSNKYVTKDVADLLGDVTLYNAGIDAMLADSMKNPTGLTKIAAGATLPVLGKIASVQKLAQIVLSPAAMAFNMVGALGLILPQNGIVPGGKTTGRALRDAARVVHSTAFKHQNDQALRNTREILMAGVMDSATVGEFQGKVYEDIFREIHRLNPEDPKFTTKALGIVKRGFKGTKRGIDYMREVYAFMDVWAKVATYYDRKDFLTQYYAAEGMDVPEEQIIRQAGYQATATNISYSMALPAARLIERNVPVMTMFLTYFTEVPRSLAFSYAQVAKDARLAQNATTAKGRELATKQAAKRFFGTTAVTAGLTALITSVLNGEDEDERRKRQLDPDYERNNPRLVLGHDDKGNEVTVSLGRIDPNGPLNEAVRQVIRAPKGRRAEALVEAATGLFVKSESIVRTFQLLADMATDGVGYEEGDMPRKRNTAIERNFPNFYNSVSNFLSAGDFGENALAALETFIPAPILGAMDPNRVPSTQERGDAPSVAARLLGYKSYVRDPDKNLGFRAKDYTDAMKDLKSERQDLFDTMEGLSANELMTKFNDLTKAEQKAFEDLAKAYDGYLAFKKGNAAAYGVLEDRRVPKEVIARARYNRFRPTLITPSAINEWYKKEVKAAKSAEDRATAKQQRAMLLRVYADKEE